MKLETRLKVLGFSLHQLLHYKVFHTPPGASTYVYVYVHRHNTREGGVKGSEELGNFHRTLQFGSKERRRRPDRFSPSHPLTKTKEEGKIVQKKVCRFILRRVQEGSRTWYRGSPPLVFLNGLQ